MIGGCRTECAATKVPAVGAAGIGRPNNRLNCFRIILRDFGIAATISDS